MRCFSTCFKKCKKEIPDVYVLLLEGGKYYVGESMDVDKRISAHKKAKVLLGQKTMKLSVFYSQLRKNKKIFWVPKKTS